MIISIKLPPQTRKYETITMLKTVIAEGKCNQTGRFSFRLGGTSILNGRA